MIFRRQRKTYQKLHLLHLGCPSYHSFIFFPSHNQSCTPWRYYVDIYVETFYNFLLKWCTYLNKEFKLGIITLRQGIENNNCNNIVDLKNETNNYTIILLHNNYYCNYCKLLSELFPSCTYTGILYINICTCIHSSLKKYLPVKVHLLNFFQ